MLLLDTLKPGKQIMGNNHRFGLISSALIILVVTTILAINLASNVQKNIRLRQDKNAYDLAKTGLQTGLNNYLLNPVNYNGEIISAPSGTVTVSLEGNVLTSTGQVGASSRMVQAHLDNSNKLIVASWQEFSP